MLKELLRSALKSESMLPLYVRLRGRNRKILVADKTIEFRSGPGEYTLTTGLDAEGRYEGPFLERMAKEFASSPNAVFYDIGGGIGVDSLVAHRFGVKQIHVFEPNSLALAFLTKNLAGVPHQLTRKFVAARDHGASITLDSYQALTGVAPTHVKMDIEGNEIYGLQGMRNILKMFRPVLFVEFHERLIKEELHLSETAINDFFDTLAGLDYVLEFNGHHYEMVVRNNFHYNYEWSPVKTNNINYAVYARPREHQPA